MLPSSIRAGQQRAILTGSMSFKREIATMSEEDVFTDTKLKVLVEGEFSYPLLELNGHSILAAGDGGESPNYAPFEINLSTDIYSALDPSAVDISSALLQFHNCSTFSNRLEILCDGPFDLIEKQSRKSASNRTLLSLKAHERASVTLILRKGTAMEEPLNSRDECKSFFNLSGSIVLKFCNGFKMIVKVNVVVSLPLLAVSAPFADFGICRTDDSVQGIILLSNPSSVRATWRLEHIPDHASSQRAPALDFTDDPAVFVITPADGQILGPTVSTNTAIHVPPRDLSRMYYH